MSKSISNETKRRMSESAKRRCADPKWIESQRNRATYVDEFAFKQMYYDMNMTQTEVAAALGVSQRVIFNFMKRNGYPSRTAAKRYQTGEQNDNWKGGRRINDQGYVEVYMPNYDHARPNGYVREHIYVAEEMLGRKLEFYGVGDPRNEVVHHINGVKTDNREENLLVLNACDHRKLHHASTKDMVDEILLRRIRQLESELSQTYQLVDEKEES